MAGGREYRVWSTEEVEALKNGVRRYGVGSWEQIKRDEDFKILASRSGVQLKDKFRNLVKFRHISLEECQDLRPKASGPWSRKHSASGTPRDRSLTPGGTKSSEGTVDDQQAQAQGALGLNGAMMGYDDPDSQGRKRRRTAENRTYGIYDQRRYQGGDGEDSDGEGRRRAQSRPMRGRGRGRRGRDFDDSETTTEEETEDAPEEDNRRGRGGYVIDCPCGIKYDDGAMMVECEDCKTWAHVGCLQHQATMLPMVSYDFNHYVCLSCQAKRNTGLGMVVPGLAGVGGMSLPSTRATKTNRLGKVAGLDGKEGAPLATRYSQDRTQEAGSVLLGLANGNLGSKQDGGLAGKGVPGMPQLATVGTNGLSSTDYLDSLSTFLAASARPGSALGHRGPTSPGSGGGVGGPRSPPSPGCWGGWGPSKASGSKPSLDMDKAASQNLDTLLAAASAHESAEQMKQEQQQQQGASSTGGPGSHDAVVQLLNRSATPSQLFLEQLMRGSTPDIGLAPLLQSSAGVAAAAAAAAASAQLQVLQQHGLSADAAAGLAGVPNLAHVLQMQAALNAATHGAANAAAAAAAAASGAQSSTAPAGIEAKKAASLGSINDGLTAQMAAQIAAQSALSGAALSLNTLNALSELRPGTPDTWALLRGSTPTPDMALPFGNPLLAGFADPNWLLQRNSPALLGAPGADPLADGAAQPAAANTSTQPAVKSEPGREVGPGGGAANGTQGQGTAAAGETGRPQQPAGEAGATGEGAAPGEQAAKSEAPERGSSQPAQDSSAAAHGGAAGEGAAQAAAASTGGGADPAKPLAAVLDMVDRKSSLVVDTSILQNTEDGYFNVEDMLRASTPALR